jgi:hypothetical protein
MKNFFVILFCLFCSHGLVAQKIKSDGYIVMATGDTLRGIISVQDSYTQVEFEQVNTNGFKLYGPESLKLFSIDDYKTYVPQDIPDDSLTRKVFGEMLVWGSPMTLFKFGDAFFLTKDSKVHVLDQKVSKYNNANEENERDTEMHVITNKRYIGMLNYLMLDCDDTKKHINNVRLEDESLIKIVKMYNHCISPNSVETKDIKRKSSMEIGLRTGMVITDTKVLNPWQPGGTYPPGYGIDFTPGKALYLGSYASIRLSPHFSFNPELNYLRRKSSAPFEKSTINFDLTFLQVALPFRYNIYIKKSAIVSFYGGAGIQLLLANNSGLDNPSRQYAEYYKIGVSTAELAVFGGAQTVFLSKKNCHFGLEVRYEFAFRHAINVKVFNMYSLSIGPMLKIDLQKKAD